MLTQTQTALTRERSASEYRETLEACQRATQRMRRLIESLLELARLDAGQEPMKRLQFDLSQDSAGLRARIPPLAAERGVKIHCELPPLECRGDAERLAQVITNLLSNAVQYNKPNGEVPHPREIAGQPDSSRVQRHGKGIMPGDYLPHVFERFYRADQSRSSGQTGLGLAISKAIVRRTAGRLKFQACREAGPLSPSRCRSPESMAGRRCGAATRPICQCCYDLPCPFSLCLLEK